MGGAQVKRKLLVASSLGSGSNSFHGAWKNRTVRHARSRLRSGPPLAWGRAVTPVGSLMLDCLCGLDWADCMHSGHTRDFERLGDRGHPYDAEFSLLPQLAKVRIGVHARCAAPRRKYPFRCVRRRCCGTLVCLAAASMRLTALCMDEPAHGPEGVRDEMRRECALVLFLARLLRYSTTRSRDYGRIEAPDSPSQCWSTACNTRQGCAALQGSIRLGRWMDHAGRYHGGLRQHARRLQKAGLCAR